MFRERFDYKQPLELVDALINQIRVAVNEGVLGQFVRSDGFWPVAVKGGFENTFRDLLLGHLTLWARATAPSLHVTGERAWGGRQFRADLLLADRAHIQDNGRIDDPTMIIELKVNFLSQLNGKLSKSVKCWATHQLTVRQVPLLVIHFIHLFESASPTDEKLLARYRAKPSARSRACALDNLQTRIAKQIKNYTGEGVRVQELGRLKFNESTGAGTGLMTAIAIST